MINIRKSLLVALGGIALLMSSPLLAQQAQSPPASPLPTDSLIAIEEDVLVESLAHLIQVRQERAKEINQANLEGIFELLRLEMLFDLFGARPIQQVTASSAHQTIPLNIETRLNQLERQLALLAQHQAYGYRAEATTSSITAPQDGHNNGDAKRLARIEDKLAALLQMDRQQPKRSASEKPIEDLIVQLAPKASVSENTSTETSTQEMLTTPQSDTIVIERTEQIVADFKRSVFFPVGKTTLDSRARAELKEVVDFLKAHPTARVSISGYASPEGAKETNERLSRGRLQAVMLYLDAEGVAPESFVGAHTGIDHDTLAHPLSRRVDIMLYR